LLSAHNSPRDHHDLALWQELAERIRTIVEEPKYQDISAHFDGSSWH
jgi:hypothetical protein